MDISNLNLTTEPLIMTACMIVGFVISNTPRLRDKKAYIPLIVAILGAVLGLINALTLDSVVSGMLSGLLSTGFYEFLDKLLSNPKTTVLAPTNEELRATRTVHREINK